MYQQKPTVKRIEMNCDDYSRESTSMSVVKFYFAGTKEFHVNRDNSVYLGPTYTNQLDRRNEELEPRRALGWINEYD